MPSLITDNPAAAVGVVRALVIATLALAVAFGAPITPDQRAAILEFTAAIVVTVSLVLSYLSHKTTVPKQPSPAATAASIQAPKAADPGDPGLPPDTTKSL